ncbi:hypothetical protein SDC9_54993 [bioreactor metagenome]|uniref:Tetratricopeptide repeat protein n=1 Tax=bioreactor metagenome TaxID=1076179 RepID=A0A644WY03_9ZZZZ
MRLIVFSFLIIFSFALVAQNFEMGIKYRVDRSTVFAEDNTFNPGNNSPGNITDTLRVSLSNNSSFIVTAGNGLNFFYDFPAQQIYYYSADSIYNISSLFSVVDYRIAEFENRKFLSGLLSQSGVQGTMGNDADIEAIFGVEDSESSVRTQISSKTSNDTTFYVFDNSVISKVHYSSHLITKDYMKSMERFLVYQVTLHPAVKEDILKKGFIPDYIYICYGDVGRTVTETHTLIDCGIRVANDIQPELKEKPLYLSSADEMGGLADSVFYHLLSNPHAMPDSNTYYQTADKLSSEGKYLSALLCVFEYILSSGNQSIAHIRPLLVHQDDADMATFLTAMSRPDNEDEAYERVKDFDKLIAKNLEYGNILNIYAANYISDYDGEKAIDYFFNALKKSPGITNAWFDLGRIYVSQYNFDTAWKCFEIVFRTGTTETNKSDVQKMKKRLKLQHPEYF